MKAKVATLIEELGPSGTGTPTDCMHALCSHLQVLRTCLKFLVTSMLPLPLEVWEIVSRYSDEHTTGLYLQLAQVNREFRRYYLSDWAWTKFDVHNVRGASARPLYTFHNYMLGGIAGHYMNFLTTLEPKHRAWHLSGQLLVGHADWNNLYDHLNRLCTLDERFLYKMERKMYSLRGLDYDKRRDLPRSDPIRESISSEYCNICQKRYQEAALVPHSVWGLVLSHYSFQEWIIDLRCYQHLFGARTICLALLKCVKRIILPVNFLTMYGYQDDWDINLALFNYGYFHHCAAKFKNNEKFILEALRFSWYYFGSVDLFLKPSFLSEVLAQNPGIMDYVADRFYRFHRRLLKREPPPRFVDNWKEMSLDQLPAAFQTYDRYVLAAVAHNGSQLQYASKDLRDSEHVVAAAIVQEPAAFQYASERLRDNKDLVLWTMRKWPSAFPSFWPKPDPGFVYRYGRLNLEPYISPRLKRVFERDPEVLQIPYEMLKNIHYPRQPLWVSRPQAWKEYLDQAFLRLPYKAQPQQER